MPIECWTPTSLSELETSIEQTKIIEVAEGIFTEEDLHRFPNEVVVTKKDKRYKKEDKFRMRKINSNNTVLHIHFPEPLITLYKKGYVDKISDFTEAYKEKFGIEYSIF